MRKFDTKVQHLKYKVLREVARLAWNGELYENLLDIPQRLVPGKEATMRCCVYKERAILGERVKLALGGDKNNPNVIEVLEIACDECPVGGYEVTNACRGCLAHRCDDVCKFGALSFDNDHVAHIDKSKCKECGACAKVCPFGAIVSRKRPCQSACRVKAISMNKDNAATIDNSKCIQCGACVYHCPFGAIADKSYIIDAVELIKNSKSNTKCASNNVYAVIAPSISSQFSYARPAQVISGLMELGFDEVVEAALGADMVALMESRELKEKGMLTSSCCPAFVAYVNSAFPSLSDKVSHTPSPMLMIAKYIKENDKNAKVIFIGPCTAKKHEAKLEDVKQYVDVVLTFEELQALFDSRDINISALKDRDAKSGSYYGRIFARSCGLSEAVKEAARVQNIDLEIKPLVCDGIDACKTALLKLNKGLIDGNFIEGMACVGGCIGGAGCLTHGEKNRAEIDRYANEAEKNIINTVSDIENVI